MLKPLNPILTVAVPPHVHCGRSIRRYMVDTLIALMPAALMAVVVFRVEALRVMALSCAVAVAAEFLLNRIMRREQSVDDYSALVTGLLFAFLLPASSPWWLVVVGSFAAIALGKMIFGGLGGSPLCPALVGWAACRISWGSYMDTNATMLSSHLAAPLQQLKYFGLDAIGSIHYPDLLLGNQLGGLGAVHVAALLVGAAYLLLRGHIKWEVPAGFIAGLLLAAWVYRLMDPTVYAPPLFHLLAGGAIFGAFFLATDPSSSPIGRLPAILFGLMAGAMVVIIRVYGMYPDGVPFAILLANLFTPLLDRIRPKPFGGPYSFQSGTEGA
ncbi:RnfABCDGE type electron transport complex subunit D [Pseudodesulfovibrio methanolicus]|uniref:Ion-translocating oxidoreductase complex subunit D n=1 Tax=Pseudodesulfovibrio methanolicus TaxID=3126690 RepID=A0ABZ2IX54_9BACT